MSTYNFRLGGRAHGVVVEEHADGPRFVVEGEPFRPQAERLGKGHYRVVVEGATFEFTVQNGLITDGVRPLDLEVQRDRPTLARKGGLARRGQGAVKPPMPGKIVEVNVKPGDRVSQGDVLVVLEAMKMQNDVKAPHAGIVLKVHVQAGASVESSTILVDIGPDEAKA
ncbi:MAG: biotin/lipoyl-containing protein [Thermoplasmatota archaeon]